MIRVVSIPMWLFADLVERPDALDRKETAGLFEPMLLIQELGAMLELRPDEHHEHKVDFN